MSFIPSHADDRIFEISWSVHQGNRSDGVGVLGYRIRSLELVLGSGSVEIEMRFEVRERRAMRMMRSIVPWIEKTIWRWGSKNNFREVNSGESVKEISLNHFSFLVPQPTPLSLSLFDTLEGCCFCEPCSGLLKVDVWVLWCRRPLSKLSSKSMDSNHH